MRLALLSALVRALLLLAAGRRHPGRRHYRRHRRRRRPPPDYLFDDSHFHLTNYVQKGTDIHRYLEIMGDKVGRSTLFGIPLQQQWSYGNSGDFAPTYYLQSDAPLYYYSFTDAYIARAYQSLPKAAAGAARSDDHRLQSRRTCTRSITSAACWNCFPGVFSGIGEFSIHKEFVSAKIAGETASLTNPALDRILDFAGTVGLAVILHNDMDMPFAKAGTEPVYLQQMKDVLRRHPNTTIIWAHIGLGRIVHPAQGQATGGPGRTQPRLPGNRRAAAAGPDAAARVLRYLVGRGGEMGPRRARRSRSASRMYSTAIRTASSSAPTTSRQQDQATQLRVYHLWDPIWAQLTPEASLKIRKGNYERVFDAARLKVRAWEKANVKPM